MCLLTDSNCQCERQTRSAYHAQRRSGAPCGSAFLVSLREFEKLHPDYTIFEAMAAVKHALSEEVEAGIVDSGSPLGEGTVASS